MQFLHEHDMLGSLQHATLNPVHGTFNVAGEGLMMLSQAIRRIGRPSLKLPTFAVATFGSAMRQARLADFSPEQVAFLTFGRGVDTTRMRTVLGYAPRYSTQAAFADFSTALTPGVLSAARVEAAEATIKGVLASGGGTRA
jgi:UDP-glucose 4-epimerase